MQSQSQTVIPDTQEEVFHILIANVRATSYTAIEPNPDTLTIQLPYGTNWRDLRDWLRQDRLEQPFNGKQIVNDIRHQFLPALVEQSEVEESPLSTQAGPQRPEDAATIHPQIGPYQCGSYAEPSFTQWSQNTDTLRQGDYNAPQPAAWYGYGVSSSGIYSAPPAQIVNPLSQIDQLRAAFATFRTQDMARSVAEALNGKAWNSGILESRLTQPRRLNRTKEHPQRQQASGSLVVDGSSHRLQSNSKGQSSGDSSSSRQPHNNNRYQAF
ncbi:hypothetical protein CORC01_09035 [Colletotrichum orchidophilum]|uniref:Uncharacterized protein n=1 Tax=Colletotrichum orchidophilum TaxID=1209926 RepID=A0A1G4B2P1_9PEZI|nr:uncharacterized protein CORC01_09035 [Colletotrichum orchidophilum]OHE95603.1 hypothetical protein CORC01_09035 [Colletotrichum orchidophilum]